MTKTAKETDAKAKEEFPEDKKVVDLGEVPTAVETTDGKSVEQVEKGVKLENKAAEYPAVVKLPRPTGRNRWPASEHPNDEYNRKRAELKAKIREIEAKAEAEVADLRDELEQPEAVKAERVEG